MPDPRTYLPDGLTPFSEVEVQILQTYRELVAEFEDRALASRQNVSIRIFAQGDAFEDVGSRDEIIALATTFRKLGWAQNEPVTFDRVRNMVAKHARDAGTPEGQTIGEWAKDIKGLRGDMLKRSRVFAYVLEKPDGSQETLTPKEILDMFINGAVFHSDEQLRARWKALGGWESVPLVTNALLTMWDMVQVFRALDLLAEAALGTPELMPTENGSSGEVSPESER